MYQQHSSYALFIAHSGECVFELTNEIKICSYEFLNVALGGNAWPVLLHCFVRSYELLEQVVFSSAQAKHFFFSLSVLPPFPPCLFSTDEVVFTVFQGMTRDLLAARWPGQFLGEKRVFNLKAKKTRLFRNFNHFKSLKSFSIHIKSPAEHSRSPHQAGTLDWFRESNRIKFCFKATELHLWSSSMTIKAILSPEFTSYMFSFPRILAHLISIPKRYFLSLRKQEAFSYFSDVTTWSLRRHFTKAT